jgi:predicted CoA-binding protein
LFAGLTLRKVKKTVIVGASPNQDRYAFQAASLLKHYGHEFVPIGIKRGEVLGKSIQDIRTSPVILDVDTITMYVRAELQKPYYDYILSLKPKRIIFNPGAENYEFADLAEKQGVEPIEACTLVMLRTGQF